MRDEIITGLDIGSTTIRMVIGQIFSYKKALFLMTVFILVILNLFISSNNTLAAPPSLEPRIPGLIVGTGTHFELKDSKYLNIAVDSGETVNFFLKTVPDKVIMRIESVTSATSTRITVYGLDPSSTYYKYQDDYHNLEIIATGSDGNYTYEQDISEPHLIFIQKFKGTKFIRDNTTGGDCALFGVWYSVNKTCLLTKDISGETVQIDSNGITFDGNGYKITNTGWRSGVYLSGRSNVTIKNLRIEQTGVGISLYNSDNNTIINNTVSNSRDGIELVYSDNNTIPNNTIESNDDTGILLWESHYNNLTGNTVNNNGYLGIALGNSGGNILRNNGMSGNQQQNFYVYGPEDFHYDNDIDQSNTIAGQPIFYVKNAVNQTYNGATNAGTFYCINCRNVTIKDISLASYNMAGIFFWKTENSVIENITSANNSSGIEFYYSHGNSINNSTVSDSEWQAIYLSESNNNSINNNIIINSEGGIVIDKSNNNIISRNTISQNQNGIVINSGSDNNEIINNTINNNTGGISIEYSYGNRVYNNNFIDNTYYQAYLWSDDGVVMAAVVIQNNIGGNVFNLPAPIGGNYWSDFDTSGEGCEDNDNNNFCDTPYMFTEGQDDLPWTTKDGWAGPTNQAPTLSYPQESEYQSDGLHPNTGFKATRFTFKTIYTDQDNDAPEYVKVFIDGMEYAMATDTTATTTLRDGEFANGEQFIWTTFLSAGSHQYYFEASDEMDNVRLPETGELAGPEVKATINVAVILAEPSDVPHIASSITTQPCKLIPEKIYANGHSKEYYEDLVYCVKDYYLENSYGLVNLDFTAIYDNNGQWFKITDPNKTESYYANNKENEFVADAINLAVNSGVDLSGQDIVAVVHGGTSSQKSGEGHLSTKTWTPPDQPLGYPPYKIIAAEYDPVGGWMHEIGHITGALVTPQNTATPDLYKMGLDGGDLEFITKEGMWDLMSRGSWNEDGKNPPYISSYLREFLGWLNYQIYPKSSYGEHWIDSLETVNFKDAVFRYNLSDDINDNSRKYYILEARNKNLKTWDSSLPENKALVLYYVDTKGYPEYGYAADGIMNNQHRLISIPALGGVLTPDGDSYLDMANLLYFSALSDEQVANQYRIKSKIEKVDYNFFSNKFQGIVLDPASQLYDKVVQYHSLLNADNIRHAPRPTGSFRYEVEFRELERKGAFAEWPRQYSIEEIVKELAVIIISFILLNLLFLLLKRQIVPRLVSVRSQNVSKSVLRILRILFAAIFIIVLYLYLFNMQKLVDAYEFIFGIDGMSVSTNSVAEMTNPPFLSTGFPDLDLHVYTDDGKHVGMNYGTGEYEVQIDGAIVSGDNQGSPEWILLPQDITNWHYVISSYDTQKFLEENPDIAGQITDTTETYEVYARYIDPSTDIYTSPVLEDQIINPGEFLEHTYAGTTTIEVSESQPADEIAPITTINTTGTEGDNGWYISDATIELTATDNLVGVEKIEYSLDNGNNWIIYAEPVILNTEGIHIIQYRSYDYAGNTEAIKTREIKIDKTPPEAKVYFDADNQDLKVEGIDNLTLNPSVSIIEDENGDDKHKHHRQEEIIYEIKDEAGHILKVKFKKPQTHGKEIKAELETLQYNNETVIELPQTELKYEWSIDKKAQTIKELEQEIKVKDQFDIKAKYNHKKDETKITIKLSDEKESEQIASGVVILELTTDKGSLGFGF